MNAIFKKLNYKDQTAVYVVNAPESFQPALKEMRESVNVKTSLAGAKGAAFAMAFVTKQAQVDKFAAQVARATVGDAVVWVAYPKGSSKKYTCEFNRDTGWTVMGENGFEPVRQVAIDADWSALRFRRVEHIKTLTRSFAITETGKERTAKRKAQSGVSH